MEQKVKRQVNVRYIAELGMFIGIILVLQLTGLNDIQIIPGLKLAVFALIAIGIGAMLLGPLAGTILGFFYGMTSLYSALTGRGGILTFIYQEDGGFLTVLLLVLLCVGVRTLVGFATGWLFRLFQKIDKKRIWSYFAGGLLLPLLNTILFMCLLVLFFYGTQAVQKKAAELGAISRAMFIILFAGINAPIEWAAGLVVGGSVAKGVAYALKRYEPIPFFKPVVSSMTETAEESVDTLSNAVSEPVGETAQPENSKEE